jgi:hypothetical protein
MVGGNTLFVNRVGQHRIGSAAALKSGKVPLSAILALKPEYLRDTRTSAHRRLALAARRLADALKQTW